MSTELLMPNAALALAELIVLGALSWLAIYVSRLVLTALSQMEPVEGRQMMGEERRQYVADHVASYIKVLAGLTALGIVGYNAWLTASGYSGPQLVMDHLARVSPRRAALVAAEIVAVMVLLKLLSWVGQQLRDWTVQRLKAARVVRVADKRIEDLGTTLRQLIASLLWYTGAILIAGALDLSEEIIYWVGFIFSLAVIWSLVRLISDALDVAIDAIYQGLRREEQVSWQDATAQQLRGITSSVKVALRWSVYIAAAAYVVRTAPLGPTAFDISTKVIKAAGIVIGAQILLAVAMGVITHLAAAKEGDAQIARQRRETMLPLIGSVLRYAIYFVAGVMALQQLGVDVTAILAGAGIVGIAVGFGAQSLVQDVISGFFTLFEGEYMVGDYIEVMGQEGWVEALTLRETTIRRRDGALVIVPNGQINEIINYSKLYVNAVVDVGVSYEGDLMHAIRVLEDVGRDAREDIADITGPPNVSVTGFNSSDVPLRLSVPVKPGRHIEVARELMRRVKLRFDDEGVEIPFSRHVLIMQNAEGEPMKELPVRLVDGRGA